MNMDYRFRISTSVNLKIQNACKIYDTRVGTDPDLIKEDLMDDDELLNLAILGDEYGVSIRKT